MLALKLLDDFELFLSLLNLLSIVVVLAGALAEGLQYVVEHELGEVAEGRDL